VVCPVDLDRFDVVDRHGASVPTRSS